MRLSALTGSLILAYCPPKASMRRAFMQARPKRRQFVRNVTALERLQPMRLFRRWLVAMLNI